MRAVTNRDSLFPILSSAPVGIARAPVGIARLAAEAEHADDGHLVEFRAMEVRSILNRTVSKRRLSLAYGINPYRGCEFGCKYCYARYTHEFLLPDAPEQTEEEVAGGGETLGRGERPACGQGERLAPGPELRSTGRPEMFERLIFLKKNAAWLLEQELRKVDPAEEIAIGTATDPYQPIERRARVTRSLLEVFRRRSGYRIGIVTKSQLILRDLDLLVEIARKNTLVVHLTITTADAVLARKLEPRAPRPDLRFAAVGQLRDAGICTGVLCSPLLPGISDNEGALAGVARRAAEAKASFFAAQPLFLKACSRPTYLSFVREHFPALEGEYAARFATADFAARPYREEMEALVSKVCRRYGLPQRSTDALLTRDAGRRPPASTGPESPSQRLLFG